MTANNFHLAEKRAAIAQAKELVSLWGVSSAELAALDRELDKGREAARQSALRAARQLVSFWNIQPEELKGKASASEPVKGPAIKYQHPATGETWDGSGPQPDWLRQALLKDGYRLDEIRPGTEDFERAKLRAQERAESASDMPREVSES